MSALATGPVRDRNSSSRAASSGSLADRPRRRARRRARRGTSSPSGRRCRSRARAVARSAASRRSSRRPREPDGRPQPRSSASSGTGSRAPRARRGRRPSGGGPVWSNSTVAHTPAPELVEHDAGAVVRAFGARDRLTGGEQGEDDRGRRRHARREEERLPAVELAEPPFGLDHCRARVARVGELARLAVLVRPRRRAVERLAHVPTVTAPTRVPRVDFDGVKCYECAIRQGRGALAEVPTEVDSVRCGVRRTEEAHGRHVRSCAEWISCFKFDFESKSTEPEAPNATRSGDKPCR